MWKKVVKHCDFLRLIYRNLHYQENTEVYRDTSVLIVRKYPPSHLFELDYHDQHLITQLSKSLPFFSMCFACPHYSLCPLSNKTQCKTIE